MIEFLFQFIAVLAYLICGIRIACYSRKQTAFHRGYSWLATLLIASLLDGYTVFILCFYPVFKRGRKHGLSFTCGRLC